MMRALAVALGLGTASAILSSRPGGIRALQGRDPVAGSGEHWAGPAFSFHGIRGGTPTAAAGGGPVTGGPPGYGITYHGGPLISSPPVTVYYIWYGGSPGSTWGSAGDPATAFLTSLAQSIGGTPWHAIQGTYGDGKTAVPGAVTFGGSYVAPPLSVGTRLRGSADLQSILRAAVTSGGVGPSPPSSSALFFILTAPAVTIPGFCTQFCGFHSYMALGGVKTKYAWVGDADAQCPSACMEQTTSPSGLPGPDGMASVIAHELAEAATDPLLSAWYDAAGYENADKCAWTFGATTTTQSGARWNVEWGGLKLLIQQNWVNAAPAGYCALQV